MYSTAYQELSQNKKILKTKVLKDVDSEDSGDGYTEYSLPSNMYQLVSIIALDENNNDVTADYKKVGKKVYIRNESKAKYVLEYYAYPTVINEETKDDFVLEIDQDVQFILPYAVANDILKVDPSSDYTAFYQEYQRKLQNLDTKTATPTVILQEGVL